MDAESEGEAGLRVSVSPRSFRGLKVSTVYQFITEGLCHPHLKSGAVEANETAAFCLVTLSFQRRSSEGIRITC